jgi:ComF family protein
MNLARLRPIGLALLDTLLPPNCLACDAPVAADGQFCLPCFRQANFISAPFCAHCGVPLPFAGATGFCTNCATAPPAFVAARAALRYDDLAKKLILPFKYADRPEAARSLAVIMARAGQGLLAGADVLVPVPLHKTRLRHRGYNQAVLLAANLARRAGKPVLRDALVRPRPTPPLRGLGVAARQAAMAGTIAATQAAADQLAGRAVLLVDDVLTTGTTAHECAKVLLAAGARRVDVLTIARVADPRFE